MLTSRDIARTLDRLGPDGGRTALLYVGNESRSVGPRIPSSEPSLWYNPDPAPTLPRPLWIAMFDMNAQFRWDWAKSIWWILLGGIPISFAFYYSTRWYYEYFQNYWYVRPIGFGMATLVFGILTWLILDELPDTRTIICLCLSVIIIILQLSHLIIK